MTTDAERVAVSLRSDQWDLIVLALRHVRAVMDSETVFTAVDRLARQFTRRRIDETVSDVQATVPAAGK